MIPRTLPDALRWIPGFRGAVAVALLSCAFLIAALPVRAASGSATGTDPASAVETTFCNPASITIPQFGPGSPFPSQIVVSGLNGTVSNVSVQIRGLGHDFYGDIDMLLVGPDRSNVRLMSDTSDTCFARGTDVNFQDGMPPLPDIACPESGGYYRPTNYAHPSQPPDHFLTPSRLPDWGDQLSLFNGTAPNGPWSLYVEDDFPLFRGSIANGWCVSLTTARAADKR